MSQAIEASYRRPGRPGIRQAQVDQAADALLRSGKKPTIEKIRERTGGSTQSLIPMLDNWWQRLFARMQLTEPAFQKLPGALPELAEAFFLCAVDEAAKVAAAQKQPEQARQQEREREVEVRVHALRLAEEALRERHAMHGRETEALHSQLRELTLLLRKSQATRDALERRVRELEEAIAKRPAVRRASPAKRPAAKPKRPTRVAASRSRATPARKRAKQTSKAKRARR
jgi:hypothetical protein